MYGCCFLSETLKYAKAVTGCEERGGCVYVEALAVGVVGLHLVFMVRCLSEIDYGALLGDNSVQCHRG